MVIVTGHIRVTPDQHNACLATCVDVVHQAYEIREGRNL